MFRNKTLVSICILLMLVIPSLILVIKNPLYPSQDGLYHIARIKEFDTDIRNLQIPPRLAPTLENQIGYPLFVANYQLPYYFAEIFALPTNDPTFAFKATMSIAFILSAVFAFLLFKKSASNTASLVGTIFYTYLPYRFANLYDRGSLGESIALIFVPLVLLGLHEAKAKSKYSFVLLAISLFALITSHTVIFMVFAPFFLFYFLIVIRPDQKTLKRAVVASILAIILSSFQLIPSIFEKKYMVFDSALTNLYNGHFLNIYQLLRIPHPGVNLGTPFQIGLSATLVIILSLILKKSLKVVFMLFTIALGLFLTLPVSKPLWQNAPLLNFILYPWRFLSLIGMATSFLAVYLVDTGKYRTFIAAILIILTIFASRHYFLKPAQLQPNLPTANLTTSNEYDTIWSNPQTFVPGPLVSSNPQSVILPSGQNPFDIKANVINPQLSQIVIRKMYFPGWILKINGKQKAIDIKDGLIATTLEPGNWQIQAYFTESPLRLFSDILTLVGFIALAGLIIKPKLASKI